VCLALTRNKEKLLRDASWEFIFNETAYGFFSADADIRLAGISVRAGLQATGPREQAFGNGFSRA